MWGPNSSGVPRSLAAVGFRIVPLFESLAQRWHDIDDHLGLDGEKVANEQDRSNLWAVNLGLHQRGHASLNYRFRDAENLYQYSMKVLDDLLHALKSSKLPLHLSFLSFLLDRKVNLFGDVYRASKGHVLRALLLDQRTVAQR
jgi:hypothetical protein